jgi:hypothetical protein
MVFCLEGDFLLTSEGPLIDVTTGKEVRTLPFGVDQAESGVA